MNEKSTERTKQSSVRQEIEELEERYVNGELTEAEYEAKFDKLLTETPTEDLEQWNRPVSNDSQDKQSSLVEQIESKWMYIIIALFLLLIPLTRGRAVIFAVPLVILWVLLYAKQELSS